jgi:hypothetical protein
LLYIVRSSDMAGDEQKIASYFRYYRSPEMASYNLRILAAHRK